MNVYQELAGDKWRQGFLFEDDFLIVAFPFADGFVSPVADKLTIGEKQFLDALLLFFENDEWITNAKARELSGGAEGSVKRYLRVLTNKQVLEAQGERKNRRYRLAIAKEDTHAD